MEEWRDIPGYEGKYMASNQGNIKSLNYKNTGKEKILVLHKERNNYRTVHFKVMGKDKRLKVHRLVWMAFNGEIPEGFVINHIDENPANNALNNLSLMTQQENANWGTRNARISLTKTNGKRSKPVLQIDMNGDLVARYPSLREVERINGFDNSFVSLCCRGVHKQAYGFQWRYA